MTPEIVLKAALAEVTSITSENPNGEFHVILSTSSLDRDGEVVEPGAFDPLPDHITFDIDHGLSVRSVVGSGKPFYSDETKTQLEVKGTYASTALAQETRALVSEGHIRTTSVAMKATKTKAADGVVHIPSAELWNGSFVAVPANREALVLSSKSVKAGARHSAADLALVQSAHDAMTSLGADCAGMKAATTAVSQKSIVGSVEALQDRCRDALDDAYPGRYTCLRGVIQSDGGGTVVFDTPNDDWDLDSYQQLFTDDGTVVTLVGDPTAVDVMEVVLPDADAARDEQVEGNPLKSAVKNTEHDEVVAAEAATDAAKAAPVTADAAEATETARARLAAHRAHFLSA